MKEEENLPNIRFLFIQHNGDERTVQGSSVRLNGSNRSEKLIRYANSSTLQVTLTNKVQKFLEVFQILLCASWKGNTIPMI